MKYRMHIQVTRKKLNCIKNNKILMEKIFLKINKIKKTTKKK